MILIKSGLVFNAESGFSKKDILVDDSKIIKLDDQIPDDGSQVIDAAGCYVVPGFIDIHTHGANGSDTMSATYNDLNNMSRFFASRGVTSFLPTTMTSSIVKIVEALENVRDTMKRGTFGARILGIHLEGPFISRKYKGAQGEEYIMHPSVELIKSFIRKADDNIKVITLAPELEGVEEIVDHFRDSGIVFAIGHSAMNSSESLWAFKLGIRHVTHLFNAMMGLQHREPGLVGAALDDENVTAEIIADGIHVYPSVVRIALKCKGPGKIALVTDSSMAAGLEDGEYILGEQRIRVVNREARLANGVLAGSTLTMIDAVKNMVRMIGVSLEDAIIMAAETPARIINIFDKKGSLEQGKDADIVLLDRELSVRLTIVEGKII